MRSIISANRETDQDDKIGGILSGAGLDRILHTSPDKSPQLLGVVKSSTNEPSSAKGLAPLEQSHGETAGSLFFVFSTGR